MKIKITVEVIGNPFSKDPWSVNPMGWSRRQRKVAAERIKALAGTSYVRQVRVLKTAAKENGVDLGLKEAVDIVKRMNKEGFLERNTYGRE